MCPSCHRNSADRSRGLVLISHRTTFAHWFSFRGRSLGVAKDMKTFWDGYFGGKGWRVRNSSPPRNDLFTGWTYTATTQTCCVSISFKTSQVEPPHTGDGTPGCDPINNVLFLVRPSSKPPRGVDMYNAYRGGVGKPHARLEHSF